MEERLFEKIIENTGLPEKLISQDFIKAVEAMGFDKENITLDQLREVLSEYLKDVILRAREEYK